MASSGKAAMTPRKAPIARPVRAPVLRDLAPAMRPMSTPKAAIARPIQKRAGMSAGEVTGRAGFEPLGANATGRSASGLDAEADSAGTAAEAGGLRLEDPRHRQHAVEVLEEAGEEGRGLAAAEALALQHDDPVGAFGEAQRADPVVVQDAEGRGARARRSSWRRRRANRPAARRRSPRGSG